MQGVRTIWPVILSGGAGSRLWPLSRAALPKQLLPLVGEETMIQATAARTSDHGRFHPPIIVSGAAHAALIADGLAASGYAPAAIIAEPVARNTAPAIALAAEHIAATDPDGLMLVMPSDHVIADPAAFRRAIDAAAPLAADGWLVTFGITPTGPETGYGYIHFGEALDDAARQVARFVEKPDRATATDYVASGEYAWNAGIFLFSAARVLAALDTHAPAIRAAVTAAMAAADVSGADIVPDAGAFAACPSDSIDYAVMERDPRVAVVPVDMGWSDVGSWSSLKDISAVDASDNVASGDVIAIDTSGCLLRSEGPVLAAIGLTDLTVVATDDAVLVARLDRAQDVKTVVDRLAAAKRRHHVDAPRIGHSWGSERILTRAEQLTVAELTIEPGRVLPPRAGDQLLLASGRATVGGTALSAGQPHAATEPYRLDNPGPAPATVIEIRFTR